MGWPTVDVSNTFLHDDVYTHQLSLPAAAEARERSRSRAEASSSGGVKVGEGVHAGYPRRRLPARWVRRRRTMVPDVTDHDSNLVVLI